MTARAWTTWLLLAVTGIAALAGLIWIGVRLFPLMSWDVYETGRLLIVGLISGLVSTFFGDMRRYWKGRRDGEQTGHDRGYQVGWEEACNRWLKVAEANGFWDQDPDHLLGFPHNDSSRIYTTE